MICLLLGGNQKTRSKSVLNVEFFSLLFIFFKTFFVSDEFLPNRLEMRTESRLGAHVKCPYCCPVLTQILICQQTVVELLGF